MEPTPFLHWKFLDAPKRKVFVKREDRNPTGSIKDRMAGYVLDLSIEEGLLAPGTTVVEASSGNAGAAIACAARDRGLMAHICVAATTSPSKIAEIERYGAVVERIDTENKPGAEIHRARELGSQPGYFLFNQFENPLHLRGYRENLVPEILSDLVKGAVHIDTFLCGVGTGASLIAVGTALRKFHNQDLRIIAVSPAAAPTAIEGLHPGDLVPEGHFPIWRERPAKLEHATIQVSDREAYEALLEIENAGEDLPGPSTGALVAALKRIEKPGNVLLLVTDSGSRYGEKIAPWRKR